MRQPWVQCIGSYVLGALAILTLEPKLLHVPPRSVARERMAMGLMMLAPQRLGMSAPRRIKFSRKPAGVGHHADPCRPSHLLGRFASSVKADV